MRGYKVFNPNWRCRGFQYKVGETYEMDEKPRLCDVGFHFCKRIADCFNFYRFDSDNKVAEIEALGDIDTDGGVKSCTNKIKIVRELTWQEVLDLVNIGKHCTGFKNTGNNNSGNYNSGYGNCGSSNSGYYNYGNSNSGNCNKGCHNSGNRNSGCCNTGDYNSGYCNTGDYNSGNYNSGIYNSGYSNCGNGNSGDYNTGNWNSGNYNSGDFNKASFSTGCFNTEYKPLFFFDKPTSMTFTQWRDSQAYMLLEEIDFDATRWIPISHMSSEEIHNHPEAETIGGYFKNFDNSDCFIRWWHDLTDGEKDVIKAIPNFNADKFFEITGIRVNTD